MHPDEKNETGDEGVTKTVESVSSLEAASEDPEVKRRTRKLLWKLDTR